MKSVRTAPPWFPRGGSSPWWLAAVAGFSLGLLALATCIGLITPPPRGREAMPAERGAAAAAAATVLDSESGDAADEVEGDGPLVAERAAAATDGAPRGADSRVPRPGSERWHVQRLRALAASDPAEFRGEAHERFDAAKSSEQFAFLRVALACDAALADELGRALLEQGRRDDDDRFAAAVTLLQKQAARSNVAAKKLLASLTAEEAARFTGRRSAESEPAEAR